MKYYPVIIPQDSSQKETLIKEGADRCLISFHYINEMLNKPRRLRRLRRWQEELDLTEDEPTE
jgi:hypothetical protein